MHPLHLFFCFDLSSRGSVSKNWECIISFIWSPKSKKFFPLIDSSRPMLIIFPCLELATSLKYFSSSSAWKSILALSFGVDSNYSNKLSVNSSSEDWPGYCWTFSSSLSSLLLLSLLDLLFCLPSDDLWDGTSVPLSLLILLLSLLESESLTDELESLEGDFTLAGRPLFFLVTFLG